MKPGFGIAVIVVAIIWAAVIFAVSTALQGVPQASQVLQILGGGAAASIILLGGLATQAKRVR
jgi:hypothetical protein